MKLFNPKKCPYEQLKEHTGEAIVYVDNKKKHRQVGVDRIRHVVSNPTKGYGYVRDEGYVVWDEVPELSRHSTQYGWEDTVEDLHHNLELSCYEHDLRTEINDGECFVFDYSTVIERMKKYDSNVKLQIVHIEFN